MLQYLIERLGLCEKNRVLFIAYFQKSFNINMRDAIKIGAWNYFEGGTWDIQDVEREVQPAIKNAISKMKI